MSRRPVGRAVLVRYRVMAFTTATLLIVLVFVGVPLQLLARRPQVVNVVGTMHGFLYIAYLYVAFQLTRRLGIPKWQMALVLLAGTVPFCAFVAERKLTRRFESVAIEAGPLSGRQSRSRRSLKTHTSAIKRRWFSGRALLLHLELAIVAPACVAAGWWQATRALAGNGLSWVYSVEWPLFALLAIVGWWHLIHEDPDAYRARRLRPRGGDAQGDSRLAAGMATGLPREDKTAVAGGTARLAAALAALVGAEFVLGIMAVLSIPFGRPSGWLPARGDVVYLTHAVLGLVLIFGAAVLLVRAPASARTERIVGWIGFLGVSLAGLGGLLTEPQSLVRFLGMALMLVGSLTAALGYLLPTFFRLQHEGMIRSEVASGE